MHLHVLAIPQDYNGAIKVVKVEHDANPKLIAEYKVRNE